MIKAKSKKIGAFLTALAVTVSMMPALAAPSFAAETEEPAAAEQTMIVEEDAAAEAEMDNATEENAAEENEAVEAPVQEVQNEEPNQEELAGAEDTGKTVSKFNASSNSKSASQTKAYNTTSTANIELNKTYTGSIKAHETKRLAFTTTSRDSYYEIKIINSTVERCIIADLYDRNNLKLTHWAVGTHDSGILSYFPGEKKLEKNQTYYLNLEQDYRNNNAGVYVVSVKEIKDNLGDSYDKAKSFSTGTIKGAVEVKGDEDWVKFTAPSNGKYRVKLINSTNNRSIYFNRYSNYLEYKDDGIAGSNSYTEKEFSYKKGQVSYFQIAGEANKYVFSIQKIKNANPMVAKGLTKKAKQSDLKKAAKTIKAINVTKAQGAVTYTKASGSKKLTVNKKTGKITVAKKTAKGTYTVKVKVNAAGNGNYKAKTTTVKVTIKVQ